MHPIKFKHIFLNFIIFSNWGHKKSWICSFCLFKLASFLDSAPEHLSSPHVATIIPRAYIYYIAYTKQPGVMCLRSTRIYTHHKQIVRDYRHKKNSLCHSRNSLKEGRIADPDPFGSLSFLRIRVRKSLNLEPLSVLHSFCKLMWYKMDILFRLNECFGFVWARINPKRSFRLISWAF